MKEITTAKSIIEISSITLSIALQKYIVNLLMTNALLNNNVMAFFASVIIVFLLFIVLRFVLLRIINTSTIRKLILKDNFIEGQWAEIVYDREGKPVSYGLLTIKGKGSSILIHGDSFDLKTHEHIGSFKSNSFSYSEPNLSYHYKYDQSRANHITEGVSRIKFISRGKKEPIIHTGFFFDIENESKYNFTSWKIIDKKLMEKIESPENFNTEILSYIQRCRKTELNE